MRHVVGVADMKLSASPGDIIVTHALGSCLGIAIFDPLAKIGGLAHLMLPDSRLDPLKAQSRPLMFVDTGLALLFREAYDLGAVKRRLIVYVAGGASRAQQEQDSFEIGKRNLLMLRKLFWRNGILIASEAVGGSVARNMSLEVGTGLVTITPAGVVKLQAEV
jgi:chemotaxis protein CheD